MDYGAWRSHGGIVLRLGGVECLFSEEELSLFAFNLRKLSDGQTEEFLSEGYKEICEEANLRKSNDGVNLLKKLGLLKEVQVEEGL